ncbi:MAG: crossover junction endodeoxyribonuclease RuvC [Lentisphaeria bacterium]|nr:crossover junction endodeoxyribonuclease RuvC [Lentisphaeria bacterium]
MVIFGIDPAIRTTGYGVIRIVDRSFEIIDCGVISNNARMPHTECLRRLYGGVAELVDLYHPDCAVLEDPFVGRNSKTAIILGMARGGILASLANHTIPAFSYTPSAAKRAAFGNGHATQEQVAYLLAAELDIAIEDIPLDSTDALALAICHAQKVLHPELSVEPKCL